MIVGSTAWAQVPTLQERKRQKQNHKTKTAHRMILVRRFY